MSWLAIRPGVVVRRPVLRRVSCELWSINRWLRYTGFRLYVEVDVEGIAAGRLQDLKPTRIGIGFFGWRDP